MNNQEIRNILIKELSIENLPEEAQNEIVSKLGEVILKSLTIAIFEKLSDEVRAKFEKVTEKGDYALVQEFLEEHVPDLHILMEQEIRKTLTALGEETGGGKEEAKVE